ncbi:MULTISPECIES: RagB/SusD family nutrient uptake outer membrane protein [Hymenobacter]|uniref:RagB/SusD family nutrient uptake outer membrane protein n=2 Tax=Hymenobacter TaxID=89966 RepID=A0ABR7MPY4_9BACT|nr:MULTISPECIES: RagB/SusD family nutrient uptake outer membrane protein [Hymenobacter]MBC6613133.1 RagB/SusD family nutrient uptake outer membrane protein [Hymenobacter citatus]MBO3270303.1 RagB/SusD family nutrient uptake outer membrane protein [Hymenobacter defluvii]
MKSFSKKYLFAGLALMLASTNSCTNLDETLYSQIDASQFYNNRQEILSGVLRPYTHANAWIAPTGQNSYWRLNEFTADQLAWPQKGRHGYDDAQWIRLHGHSWVFTENLMWNPWSLLFTGVGFCNSVLGDFERVDFARAGVNEQDKAAFIAELKVFRAFHYMKLMDLYGNIPIVTTVGEPLSPATAPRAEVFAFVEKELKENVDLLPNLSQALIGRITKAAGYSMLAELYLNAEVWSGTPRWDDCIAACDKIIQGQTGGLNGTPALDTDLKATYSNTNDRSKEILFQLVYDYQATPTRCGWNGDFYHFNQRLIYDGDANGNNGVVVIPSAYDAFKDNDLRKSTWMLIGPQFQAANPTQPVLGTEEYRGKQLVFVKEIQRNSEGKTSSTMIDGEENSGARFNKYPPGRQSEAKYWSNDWAIYRLTEIYYNKAEALMRKNNGTATPEALELVNAVRRRAFSAADYPAAAYTAATLTLPEFLAERGREFIFEGKRRTDMIRFGAFTTTSWWDHQPSSPEKRLFAIPQRQLAANPNLKQNPGYPGI